MTRSVAISRIVNRGDWRYLIELWAKGAVEGSSYLKGIGPYSRTIGRRTITLVIESRHTRIFAEVLRKQTFPLARCEGATLFAVRIRTDYR